MIRKPQSPVCPKCGSVMELGFNIWTCYSCCDDKKTDDQYGTGIIIDNIRFYHDKQFAESAGWPDHVFQIGIPHNREDKRLIFTEEQAIEIIDKWCTYLKGCYVENVNFIYDCDRGGNIVVDGFPYFSVRTMKKIKVFWEKFISS